MAVRTAVRCGTEGGCFLYERPEKMRKQGLRLQNALAHIKTRRDARLYLSNLSERPANLSKNISVGLVDPYVGPVHEIPLVETPESFEGAKVFAMLGPV